MKQMLTAMFISGLALSPWTAPAPRAQGGPMRMHGEGMSCPLCLMMTVEEWKNELGLTDEQTNRLRAAMDEHKNAVQPLMTRLKQNRDKLDEQIRNKASDEDIQATLTQIDRINNDLRSAHDTFKTDTASFLTPTQRATMQVEMKPGRRSRLGPGRGNPGSNGADGAAGADGSRPSLQYRQNRNDAVQPSDRDMNGGWDDRDRMDWDREERNTPMLDKTVPTPERPAPGPDIPSTPDNLPSQGGANRP